MKDDKESKKYKYKAIVTDYTFHDLDIEKTELAEIGVEVLGFKCKWDDEDQIIAITEDADAIFNQNTILSRRIIEHLDKCRIIVCYGAGVEAVDVEAATEYNIVVANVPDYCINEVADHAMALILSSIRRVTRETIAIKKNPIELIYGAPLFPPIFKLREQILGLIGFGNVSRNLVLKARPFGFNIIAYDPFVDENIFNKYKVRRVQLDELLKISDVVSLHLPLNKNTERMVDEKMLKKMKKTAFLINVSRGPIVDELALYKALKECWIEGAAVDTTAIEPINYDNPLIDLDNFIITNHIGYYSEGSFEDMRIKASREVKSVLNGGAPRPIAFVNPQVKIKGK